MTQTIQEGQKTTLTPVENETAFGSTPRTAKLRAGLKWKAAVVKDFINIVIGLAKCSFRDEENIRVDLDRARLITQSYKETEGLPWPLRVAKAFEHLCDNFPVLIKPGELIVGEPNSAPDELRWHPEIACQFMKDAVTKGAFSDMVTDEERSEITDDICAWWDGKSVADRIRAIIPHEQYPDIIEGLTTPIECKLWEMGIVSPTYDFEALFKEGVRARIKSAENKLVELDAKVLEIHPSEYLEKKYNWQAMAKSGRAIIRFSERYARLARETAAREPDRERRLELEQMAGILERIPAGPARTFHEAVQFYWMIEVTGKLLAVYGHGGGHRIDKILWPYYQADIEAGRITRERALELLECLFLKIQEVGIALEWPVTFTGKAGGEIFYTLNICGSDGDGNDETNELSEMVLEAMGNLHINQPPIAILYHDNISHKIVDRGLDLLHKGMGHPSWFNEDLIRKWAYQRGYDEKDARRAQVGGCVTNHIIGRYHITTGAAGVGGMLLPKVLEEAIHQGGPHGNGDRADKPVTKDPREMESADELLDAMLERVMFYAKTMKVSWDIAQQILMDTYPDPTNSLLLDEPLETGQDLKALHKKYDTYPAVFILGMITVADSLAAVHHLVFENKKYTMDELIRALKANWDGFGAMRQDFINAPKYGNDDDYADQWARKLATRFEETISSVKDAWGCAFVSDGGTAAGYQTAGMACGASPDGRLAMDHFSDGSRSPIAGADKRGPTAVLNSAAKIPFLHTDLFNQRFMPEFLEGRNKKLFASYLRAWYEKGTVPHIQFNVVDNDLLRKARERPEDYPDLQVRVAGYSAFWVDLPKGTQDSIIARTEQGF